MAAVALWVTVPHHFATWLRVYASPADFNRWRERFILGPFLMVLMAYAAIRYAPLTLVLIVSLWDHQHSLMQQYGFARIYDFKARAGAAFTARFDLLFNWILFVNMLVVSPLFSVIWVRMVHEMHLPVGADTVRTVHAVSWTATILFLVVYAGHVVWCLRRGYTLNPLKYLFLFSSYFLWYYASFSTTYLLVFAFAHRVMHGMQYIVMVYFYLRNKFERMGGESPLLAYLARPGISRPSCCCAPPTRWCTTPCRRGTRAISVRRHRLQHQLRPVQLFPDRLVLPASLLLRRLHLEGPQEGSPGRTVGPVRYLKSLRFLLYLAVLGAAVGLFERHQSAPTDTSPRATRPGATRSSTDSRCSSCRRC